MKQNKRFATRYSARCLLGLSALLLTFKVYAIPMHSLYQATLSVTTQEVSERVRLLPQALLQVLIRVSGNKGVGSLPEIATRIASASQFVERYSYQDQSQSDHPAWQLNVSFDPKAVNHLLQSAGQALWGEERPAILVWFVEGDPKKPHLLAADTDEHETLIAMSRYAELRGVPLLFPILDLYDLSRVDPHDVWQAKFDVIKKASKRYGDEPILVVRVQQEGKQFKGRWQLVFDGEPVTWHTSETDLKKVLSQGVDYVADALAERYAVLSTQGSPENIRLVIEGVNNVKDYIIVMGCLHELNTVTHLDVEEINPHEAHFILSVKGGESALREVLSQQSLLVPSNQAALGNVNVSDTTLRYHLTTQS